MWENVRCRRSQVTGHDIRTKIKNRFSVHTMGMGINSPSDKIGTLLVSAHRQLLVFGLKIDYLQDYTHKVLKIPSSSTG